VSCPAGIPVRPVPAPLNEDAVTTPETFNCLANNVGPVTVVMPAKVETPETLRLVAPMVPTVILGVPERPVAFPVRAPENVVAVTTPVTLIPLGLTFRIDEPVDTSVIRPALGEKNPV